MRDGRIGAQGAAALVLLLLGKVVALGEALSRHDFQVVLAFPTLARWAVTPLVAFFPYARAEGLGRAFNGSAGAAQVGGATAIAAVVFGVLGTRMILPGLGAIFVVGAFGLWLHRKLGGLTGDVYGAAIELGEVTILVLSDVIR